MSVHYMTRPWENRLFRQCRRAWDLGARERQNYEPAEPARVFNLDEAMREALEVYYFPGMWEWNRGIVRPLTLQAFQKSMRKQRATYIQHRELSSEQEQEWAEHLELGNGILERYFEWAPQIDRFHPLQVATQFDITVPDLQNPDVGLTTPDGRGIQYRLRIDMVVMDEHELCWLAEHRVVSDVAWQDIDQLLLDEQSLTRSWAWQLSFLTRLEGTIHNELRVGVPFEQGSPTGEPEVQALPGPHGIITQHHSAFFRRTQIPRGALELEQRGIAVALEMQDMTNPALRVYPNPSVEHCSGCVYRAPCLAMTQGLDEKPVLEASYRKRVSEDFELGRLGSVWGFVPEITRVADYRSSNQGRGR
ncbi:MAG: hypothetical protein M3308_07470 [Actinomycetota bacterium]|nr:hypothetical protein [Actinomycetota bacterium]